MVVEMQVRVELSANRETTDPSQKGAVIFKYAPGSPFPQNAKVKEDGSIDLSEVKSEVRLRFDIVKPEDMKLHWKSGCYQLSLMSNDTDMPERQSLWIAKGKKPEKPCPYDETEFYDFYYWGIKGSSIHVRTLNSDNTAPYCYALAVTLRKVGETGPGNDIVCRDDPQIRNGGNPTNARVQLWTIGLFIVAANAIATLLIGVLLR